MGELTIGGGSSEGAKTGVVTKINRPVLEKINDVDSRLRQLSIIVLFPWLGCGHVVTIINCIFTWSQDIDCYGKRKLG